jgi:RluA family pseudouridine synthase
MMFDVLYLDNHLLVVYKPPGLLVQEDRTGDPDLLTLGKAYLKEKFDKPGNVFLGLVHRLDRPASGVMVLARTSKAAARLSKQFRERTPEKRYLALIVGAVGGSGTCIDHLAKVDRHVHVVEADHPKAKRAVLQWRSLGSRDGLSLLDVRLKTGRAHQIRVQLAHQGWPILGDFRYGAEQELDGRNLALHCYHLAITHPTRRERMAWQAPPPDVWSAHLDPALINVLQQTDA